MARIYRRSYRDKKTKCKKQVGTYTIEYRGADGELVREPTKITRKPLAERLLRKRLKEVERARAGEPVTDSLDEKSHATIDELIDAYVSASQLRLKPSTVAMYEERLRYTARELGITYAREVTLAKVDTYMSERLERGSSTRTPNLQISVLRRMLHWAVQRQRIAENPLQLWKPIKDKPRKKRRALTPDEVPKLLAAAPVERRMLYMLMLATGLRRGEAIQLQITDLDFDNYQVTVRPEIAKSGRGRTIPVPRPLVAMLQEWLAKDVPKRSKEQQRYLQEVQNRRRQLDQAGQSDTEAAERLAEIEGKVRGMMDHSYLFANGRGLPMRRNLRRGFRTDLLNAGVKPNGLDLHSLRYTANTTMLASGLNPSVVRARMGHSSSRMTDLYTDDRLIIDNGDTSAVAGMLGLAVESTENGVVPVAGPVAPPLPIEERMTLRPTGEVLAELADRYTNGLVGKICHVSETTVRKWLCDAGVKRNGKKRRTGEMPDWQVALLRGDLRKAIQGS